MKLRGFVGLMFLASSGVYLKIRRFATTQNLGISSPRNSINFRVLPFSWNKEIAIFDFKRIFSPSLPISYVRAEHFERRGGSRTGKLRRNKGADYRFGCFSPSPRFAAQLTVGCFARLRSFLVWCGPMRDASGN